MTTLKLSAPKSVISIWISLSRSNPCRPSEHTHTHTQMNTNLAGSSCSSHTCCALNHLPARRRWFPWAAPPVCGALSLIQLLHTVSHRRIPSEDTERSFRLLLVRRNMKRLMQGAGLAANEQTVGGWLLPHTSAAGGPTGGKRHRQGTMSNSKDYCNFFFPIILRFEHVI